MHSWKVVVAGEGGQGVQALAESLALAAFREGLEALYIPNFGIEQRRSPGMVQITKGHWGAQFLLSDLVALSAAPSYAPAKAAAPIQFLFTTVRW